MLNWFYRKFSKEFISEKHVIIGVLVILVMALGGAYCYVKGHRDSGDRQYLSDTSANTSLSGTYQVDTRELSSQESSDSSSSSSSKTHAIILTIDGTDYQASLTDSQASRSLLERLPQELTFRDYSQGFDEKIADLDQALNYGTETYDNDPEALDIGYWSPDQRLVFDDGDVEAYAGIHIMGRFESAKAKDAIQSLTSASTVSIRLADKSIKHALKAYHIYYISICNG